MTTKNLIDIDELKKYLLYDKKTGHIYWRPRTIDMFSNEGSQKSWNTKYAYKMAGTAMPGKQIQIKLLKRRYVGGHVAWALAHGYWPDIVVHLDGNNLNTKLSNLKATNLDNYKIYNKKLLRPDGTRVGVNFDKRLRKWRAHLGIKHKRLHLGLFTSYEDAVAARASAEVEFRRKYVPAE